MDKYIVVTYCDKKKQQMNYQYSIRKGLFAGAHVSTVVAVSGGIIKLKKPMNISQTLEQKFSSTRKQKIKQIHDYK